MLSHRALVVGAGHEQVLEWVWALYALDKR